MSSITTLKLKFATNNGKNVTYSYKYADPDVNDAKVKAAMNAMIANNTIFAKPPLSIVSADIVTTDTTTVDLS